MPRVVIAGAGISGLALAWALRARGVPCEVFEREGHVGGKLGTDADDGFRCDWGPQSFSFLDPAAAALVDGLGLTDRVVPATDAANRRGILAGGRLHRVPTRPGELLRSDLLGPAAKLRAALDLVMPRGPSAHGREETIAAFGRRRLGRAATERLLYPLVSGLYAGDPAQISVTEAFPALARLEREKRSLAFGVAGALDKAGFGPRIASFQGGMGALPAALARALGPAVHTASAVVAVRRARRGLSCTVEVNGARTELAADAVVLAVPAWAAAPMVADIDLALTGALASIPYLPVALTYVGYQPGDVAAPPDLYGFLVPPAEPSLLLGAVFTSTVFPDHAPPGWTLVAARTAGSRHPEVVDWPEEKIVEAVHRELAPLLQARRPPTFRRVMRHARALPHYVLGHRRRLAVIEAAERRTPGLFFTGNAFHGLGIADCIRNAPPLAERVDAWLQGLQVAAP